MHPLLDAVARLSREPEQLDAIAELLGELDIHCGDATDALDVDALEVHLRAERRPREDRQLVRGIDAVDIEAGIGLGVTGRLRLGQDLCKVPTGLAHRRQDVVAGAVEDAIEPADLVADQAFAQRLDNRNTAGHRGLEAQDAAFLLGQRRELGAVMGQQRLVCRDDMFAVAQGGLHQTARNTARATDQLDHDVDVGRGGERQRIALPAHCRKVDVALPGLGTRAYRHQPERPAAAQRQQAVVLGQKLDHAGANSAEAGDADFEGLSHVERLIRQDGFRREPSMA